MAGNYLRRVASGEPVRKSAAFHNATVEAIEAIRRSGSSGGNGLRFGEGSQTRVRVRNDTGGDRDRFDVVKLFEPVYGPDDNLGEFQNNVAFKAETVNTTNREKYAILQEPIPQNAYGWAVVSGITPCRVYWDSGSPLFEEEFVSTDSTHDYLRESQSGSAHVLWREGGAGEQWAIVRLAGPACNPRNEIIQVTIIGQPTGGTFDLQLTLDGVTEALEIDFDATDSEVETVLESHSEAASGDFSVSGGPFPNTTMTIEFLQNFAATNIPIPTADWSGLTGGAGVGMIISVDTQGVGA